MLPQLSTTALPSGEVRRAQDFLDASVSDATRRAYRSDWQVFTAWCSDRGMSPLPAGPDTVALFLSSQAGEGLKVATINRRLASISRAHKAKGFDSPVSSDPVRSMMRGIRRRLGTAPSQKSPATAEIIREMARRLPDTTLGQRDRALLLLGFAGAFRRSELAALDVSDLGFTPEGVRVSVRRSKTDQEGRGQVKAIPIGDAFCPVRAVRQWLDAAGITEGPVFRSVRKDGSVGDSLSTKSIGEIVKRASASIGLDPREFAGHSLRSGFCTSAAKAGADLLRIADVSGHRSLKTLQGYVRRGTEFVGNAGEGLL